MTSSGTWSIKVKGKNKDKDRKEKLRETDSKGAEGGIASPAKNDLSLMEWDEYGLKIVSNNNLEFITVHAQHTEFLLLQTHQRYSLSSPFQERSQQ